MAALQATWTRPLWRGASPRCGGLLGARAAPVRRCAGRGGVRQAFGATLPVESLRVSVGSLAALEPPEEAELVETFNRFGAAIVRCRRGPLDQQAHFAALLGSVSYHARSGEDGRVPVEVQPEGPAWSIATRELAHPPHTDTAHERFPDEVMTLFCERPAVQGGLSVVVSGARVLEELVRSIGIEACRPLFDEDFLTVDCADRRVTASALRVNAASSTLQLRYRYDDFEQNSFSVAPEARGAFQALAEVIQDRENQLVFNLEEGDHLILDNAAMLHGRTAFDRSDRRKMTRMNFFVDGKGGRLEGRLRLGLPLERFPAFRELRGPAPSRTTTPPTCSASSAPSSCKRP